MANQLIADEIKKAVLATAQITEINSAACVELAQLVYQKTSKRISATTLKRVYGFAQQKYNISPYTLAVMAEYSGCFEVRRVYVRKKIITEVKPIKQLWTFLLLQGLSFYLNKF